MKLTKYQAAFIDSHKIDTECKVCGSKKTPRSSFHDMPKIDDELLAQWLADETLVFLSEDEDLIMSSTSSDLLINAHKKASRKRALQLLNILLVKTSNATFVDDVEKQLAHDFVLEHQPRWKRASNSYTLKGVKKSLGIQHA